ncbi:dTDP-4-dehydrorhamnose reductase [Aureispira anguillae]|uniref:dTDP-4-dehydrorhamnose reductase n=1 Tax=Aureispira anguillae TaxID=2864201 RepID=A0A915YGJ1_9BACT|nr:dTDP-4-dehydrorhamnose reductase [Aureispira anguillae]BDS12558.1 dTDP-4-dehydrorhamnose reductase [Aureispira anguillae]
MKILVTGANGQVGSELQALATQYPIFSFVFVDKDQLDICDAALVAAFFEQTAFDYCINCAAYTAVDKAESDEAMAELINVAGSKNLALACQKHQVRFVQISTDYVYHNSQNTPFKEEDLTSPQSVYGKTKLAGEIVALDNNPETLVIRTSWVYSSFGNNFVKTMLRLGRDRDQLTVIFDQIGSPTYARDLAKAILDIIQQQPSNFRGIYHYSNEGVCSWYDFATAIFELEAVDCSVSPIETKDYPTPAQRPPFSLLNKHKIKDTFGLQIPYWRDSLKDCLALL